MGFVWRPTAALDAGIDGEIEIRDETTGDVTNCILQVQSKATKGEFSAETPDSLEFICDSRDIEYWTSGYTPVLLVVSRPDTDEAYWVSIKDYFREPAARKTRKVRFNKRIDQFNLDCKDALIRLAIPEDSGAYLSPPPKRELLYSNLLPVSTVAPRIYIADTGCRFPAEVWNEMKRLDVRAGSEWLLANKRILSFHDLREFPWNHVCDVGTVDDFDTQEWAESDNSDRRREYVWLLNQCLKEMCGHQIRFNAHQECYFFRATRDLQPRDYRYRALSVHTTRTVFRGYPTVEAPSHYRHSAFKGWFRRFAETWFLEVTPTYYFSSNGTDEDRFSAARLSGIKKLERNEAVLGQLVMWAEFLRRGADLFTPAYPFLAFDSLQTFECDAGIDDDAWLSQDDNVQETYDTESPDQAELFPR